MHLLKPQAQNMEDLERNMAEIDDFEITVDKRTVNQLIDRYEDKNTRILIDVNTGEDEIV